MSNIYCSHAAAAAYGAYGYMVCALCGSEWYSIDPAPFVIIGVTSKAEVDRYPFTKGDKPMTKDRSNDMPVCSWCRMALHKRCEKGACTCDCERGY